MIDLRSDTVTHPTDEMRKAMAEALVGDDVYGDDPTVNRLEDRAAQIIGKEAALFVPSGTMGNQLAIMTHTKRGDEILAAAESHIVINEVGAMAVLSGVSVRQVVGNDGMVLASDIKEGFRPDNIHYPDTGLVCLENALGNGRVVPLDTMKASYGIAHELGLPVHLDGARVFNAALSLGVEAKEIAAYCDSVMFCLSKGLCAPIGSILAGDAEFIARARRNRKALGGGMRQVGVLAAPGLIALEKMTGRLQEDHDNARYLAEKLSQLEGVACDPNTTQINMVFFRIENPNFNDELMVETMCEKGILVSGGSTSGSYRVVTHNDISKPDLDLFLSVLSNLLSGEYLND